MAQKIGKAPAFLVGTDVKNRKNAGKPPGPTQVLTNDQGSIKYF